jgi:hypothetical protein
MFVSNRLSCFVCDYFENPLPQDSCSGWDEFVDSTRNNYGGGRCTLTPPDPQLKGAWYPCGFKPSPLNTNPGFKTCLSNFINLRRYTAGWTCRR